MAVETKIARVAFMDKGAYSAEIEYSKWDFVTTADSTYLYIGETPAIGKPVTDTAYWKCIADGKQATLAAAAAAQAAETANDAASLADQARLAIETELGEKAAHGYDVEETPKTLKEVDTLATQNAEDISQLAGDLSDYAKKDDTVRKDSLLQFPYKKGATGVNIPKMRNLIRDIYIKKDESKPTAKYWIAVAKRIDGARSNIGIFSQEGSGDLVTHVTFFEENIPSGVIKTYKSSQGHFISVFWDALSDGEQLTGMTTGYELDPYVFNDRSIIEIDGKVSTLEDKVSTLEGIVMKKYFPFKYGSSGYYAPIIAKAIKNIWINPDIVEEGRIYKLSTVQRNKEGVSKLDFYSSNLAKGDLKLIKSFIIQGDAANGSTQLFDSENVRVLINWDEIEDGFSFNSMIIYDGYDLDDFCFSLNNPLAAGSSADISHSSTIFESEPNLITGGFINVEDGKRASGADTFAHTGYISVYEGQVIKYIGDVYGKGGICGYPTKSEAVFVPLYDQRINPARTNFEITIPKGVNYIRASLYLPAADKIILEYNKSFNYSLIADNIHEEVNTYKVKFEGGQVNASAKNITSVRSKTRWLELEDNFAFPSKGYFIGKKGDDIVISKNGVITIIG